MHACAHWVFASVSYSYVYHDERSSQHAPLTDTLRIRIRNAGFFMSMSMSTSYTHPYLFPQPSTLASTHLLEHLPIRPRIFFAVHNNRLIPSPLIIQKLLILRLTGVELREFEALVVGCYVEGWLGLLAADDEGALDDGVVLLAVNGSGTEDVFAGGFEAGEEATCLVFCD